MSYLKAINVINMRLLTMYKNAPQENAFDELLTSITELISEEDKRRNTT